MNRRRLRLGCVALFIITLLVLVLPTIYCKVASRSHRYSLGDIRIPTNRTAIVFGAGVYQDGTPTPYLKWRLDTAVELYRHGMVKRLLLSGDNGSKQYNEPEAMKIYATTHGVAEQDITLDYAGFSTYDTCYRAAHIFNVTKATVVTQGYHLPRAVVTCRGVGINAVGVAARHDGRDYTIPYIMREYVSTLKAMVQLVLKPRPMVLGKVEAANNSGQLQQRI